MRASCFRPLAMGDGMERHHAPGSHGDHSGQSFLSKVAAGWCNKITHEKTKREKSRDSSCQLCFVALVASVDPCHEEMWFLMQVSR